MVRKSGCTMVLYKLRCSESYSTDTQQYITCISLLIKGSFIDAQPALTSTLRKPQHPRALGKTQVSLHDNSNDQFLDIKEAVGTTHTLFPKWPLTLQLTAHYPLPSCGCAPTATSISPPHIKSSQPFPLTAPPPSSTAHPLPATKTSPP
jgi:hypothetical protein